MNDGTYEFIQKSDSRLFLPKVPETSQILLDSITNLERVAEYCENNY